MLVLGVLYRDEVALVPAVLMELADAHAKLGRPEDSVSCLAEAAQVIETSGERFAEAELHRMQGDLLNVAGDGASTERSYHQALATAKRQSAKLWELRAAASLARLWRDQGKYTEGRDLLAPIYNWFTEGFDTPVLKDAKVLSSTSCMIQLIPHLAGQSSDSRHGHEFANRVECHMNHTNGTPLPAISASVLGALHYIYTFTALLHDKFLSPTAISLCIKQCDYCAFRGKQCGSVSSVVR